MVREIFFLWEKFFYVEKIKKISKKFLFVIKNVVKLQESKVPARISKKNDKIVSSNQKIFFVIKIFLFCHKNNFLS
jgi:hypothetical protein